MSNLRPNALKRTGVALLALLAISSGSVAEAQPQIRSDHVLWFDLDFDIGLGTRLEGEGEDWDPLWRVRAGGSLFTPYWILTIGATAQLVGLGWDRAKLALGGQLEAVHLESGISGYMGPHVYGDGTVGATVGVGWSIVYAEIEALPDDRSRFFFKLRIPLSTVAFALWAR
jgi:hypothetical protein